jgi:hypothetical protein
VHDGKHGGFVDQQIIHLNKQLLAGGGV